MIIYNTPIYHERENAVSMSVIEDIKAEINDLSELDHIDADYEDCKADVLEIIDKHIGK